MRITLRSVMAIIVFVGISLGLYVHICRLIEKEDDFAMAFLLMEGAILVFFCAVAWGLYLLVKLWPQTVKVPVLIIDGQNNHNWRAMTPPIKAELERSGRFTVDVVTTPDRSAKRELWNAFRPDFSKYDVVLSNYNGEMWPEEVRKALEDYVSETEEAWRSSTRPTTRSRSGRRLTR